MKYKELAPEVREQLEAITREAARAGRTEFDMCLAVVESELGDAGDALVQHDARSTDPMAVGLRTKVDNLEQAWLPWSPSRS